MQLGCPLLVVSRLRTHTPTEHHFRSMLVGASARFRGSGVVLSRCQESETRWASPTSQRDSAAAETTQFLLKAISADPKPQVACRAKRSVARSDMIGISARQFLAARISPTG